MKKKLRCALKVPKKYKPWSILWFSSSGLFSPKSQNHFLIFVLAKVFLAELKDSQVQQ
jgi:hypothetical protein